MKTVIKGNIEFKEEQRFSKRWFWLLLLLPIIASVIVTLITLANVIPDKKWESMIALAIIVPVNLVMLYLFYITRFEMVVTDLAIYYRWTPFIRNYKVISKPDIDEVSLRKSPLLQLGYKRVIGYGRVHNLGAEKGLQFILKSGRKVFFSSEKINSFQRAVEKLVPVSKK